MGKQSRSQRHRRIDLERPIEPIRIDVTTDPVHEEREPLFYIGDKEFTIPKEVPADFTVRYLNNVRKRGAEVAVAEAMTDLLGEDAMDELSDCPQMTNEHLRGIMKGVERKMLAASEAALGN